MAVSSESVLPERTLPDSTSPDSTFLECTSPESASPESAFPESTLLECASPDCASPKSTLPEKDPPESTLPENDPPESTYPDKPFSDLESPIELKGRRPKPRYKACLKFRISALRLPVHERYKPSRPSPLRNMVSTLDLADMPGFELPDTDIFADSLFSSPMSSASSPESPSGDGLWESWPLGNTWGSSPDKLYDSDLEEGTAEEGKGIPV